MLASGMLLALFRIDRTACAAAAVAAAAAVVCPAGMLLV
jgi:hypothetical protein